MKDRPGCGWQCQVQCKTGSDLVRCQGPPVIVAAGKHAWDRLLKYFRLGWHLAWPYTQVVLLPGFETMEGLK